MKGICKGWTNVDWKLESQSKLVATPDPERNQVSPPTFFPWPHLAAIYMGPNLARRSCQTHMGESHRMSDVGCKSLVPKINLSKPHLLSGVLPAQWGGLGRSQPVRWPQNQTLKSPVVASGSQMRWEEVPENKEPDPISHVKCTQQNNNESSLQREPFYFIPNFERYLKHNFSSKIIWKYVVIPERKWRYLLGYWRDHLSSKILTMK